MSVIYFLAAFFALSKRRVQSILLGWNSMGNYGERSPEAPNSRGRRLLLVFALLFSLCFSHIHQGSVWTDGVRYAAIAKNIILDGQYFRLYDDYTEAPYVNKPPVLFWLIAASMKALGYSTFSVKLPGALIAFGAMLLFAAGACWLFDSRTALLAVLLFSANALFFRSVVDINFEGLILCGGILLLFALLRLTHLLHLDFITALALGLGAAFLLISKPPYLLFAAPALAYALACAGWRGVLPPSIAVSAALIVPILAGMSWMPFVFSQDNVGTVLENQIVEPLTMSGGYWRNFRQWLVVIFGYFAPLSVVGLYVVCRDLIAAVKAKRRQETLLFLWIIPVLPIVLFAVCRARYLLIPLLGLALLSGRYLAATLPVRFILLLERFCLLVTVVLPVAVFGFNFQFHKTHPILAAMRMQPALLEQGIRICVGRGEIGDIEHPAKKRTEMLLELEYGVKVEVDDPGTLNWTEEGEQLLLADAKCQTQLEQQGVELRTEKEFRRAALVRASSVRQ